MKSSATEFIRGTQGRRLCRFWNGMRPSTTGAWHDERTRVMGDLRAFRLNTQEVIVGGGNRSVLAIKFDKRDEVLLGLLELRANATGARS